MVTAIFEVCLLGHGEPDPVALHVELGVESATERRNKPLPKTVYGSSGPDSALKIQLLWHVGNSCRCHKS